MMPLTVATAMTRDVYAVGPETSLETAGRLLAQRHIGGVPVIGEDGRVLGVISQHDLVDPDRRGADSVGLPRYYRVGGGEITVLGAEDPTTDGIVADIMSPYALAITPDTPLLDAVRLMVVEHVHRLIVTDRNALRGILTTMDILRAIDRWSTATPR